MAKPKKIETQNILNKEYIQWLGEIKAKIRNAQIIAASRVNTELLTLYWDLGKTITEKQSNSKWGDGIIEQLSKDLMREFPDMQGFSATNLKYIRLWYQFYSPAFSQQPIGELGDGSKSPQVVDLIGKSPQPVDESKKMQEIQKSVLLIPWGQNREIITKCKDVQEALFYVVATIQNNWTRSVLVHQIESGLYKRQGKAITNFKLTLPAPQSDLANEMLKNPYNLDFLSLGKEVQERDLERALINNLKKFLLELGKGFSYVGNQYNLTVEGDDFFLDLLFFNYHLNCFVVLELKVGDFKPEYAGKLNFYINTVDEKIKEEHHSRTVGILLCKTPNKTVVEYSLRGLDKPLGVSDYQLIKALPEKLKSDLPTVEELELELEREAEEFKSPADKKLDRLKEKISGLKQPKVKESSSPKTAEKLITKIAIPLKNEIKKTLAEISKEFKETKIMIWTDSQGHRQDKDLLQYLKEHKEFNECRIEIDLDGFKPAGTKAFYSRDVIVIQAHQFYYSIVLGKFQPQSNILFEKLYHQLPTEKEFKEVIDKCYERILDDVEKQIERIKPK